jgi:hypothetical protein
MKHLAKEAGRCLRFALESTPRTLRLCLLLTTGLLAGSLWWFIWVWVNSS